MKIFGTKKHAAHVEKTQRNRRGRKIGIAVLLFALALGGGVYAFFNVYVRAPEVDVFRPTELGAVEWLDNIPPEDGRPWNPNRPSDLYTVLLAGVDDEANLTDTIIIAAIDVRTPAITMVNIPRDTMVDVPWDIRRVNSVYPIRGIDGLLDEMERMLGFLPDHYVTLDVRAFARLVDAMNGVTFDVPVRMQYDDPCQNLHIDLQPGLQWLNGDQAAGVFRFRQNNDGTGYPDGDIGRIRTQQAFLNTVAGELLQIRNVTRIHELVDIFQENVTTNLSLRDMISYATRLMGLESENIRFFTMPGEYDVWFNGSSYVVLTLDEWLSMINTYLNPFPVPVTVDNLRVFAREHGTIQVIGAGRTLTPRSN